MSETKFTLAEIAELVGGQVASDSASIEVTGIGAIKEARDGDITFLSMPRYLRSLQASKATAALVPNDFAENLNMAVIRVEAPSDAFVKVVECFAPPPVVYEPGVHPSAVVAEDVEMGDGVSIQPNAVIEAGAKLGARTVIGANCFVGRETIIGDDCLIHPNVVVRERCTLHNRVILHSGVIVGGDGFGYSFKDGQHVKIPQTGTVIIEDDVEIGANTTVDRARFGRTWIQRGAKIDNLVMVAHNVIVGPGSILCGQVGVSGSSQLGSYVTLAGQVGIGGHVQIGDQSMVGAQSGAAKDIPANARYFGSPAMDSMHYRRRYARIQKLDDMYARLEALEKLVAEKEKG